MQTVYNTPRIETRIKTRTNRVQMGRKTAILALVASFGLAGCGGTPIEQTLIGAGAGVGVAAVAGTSLAGAALVGAAANLAYCQTYPSKC